MLRSMAAELEPYAAVDHEPVGRRPGLDRPASVGRTLREEQRVIFGLPDIENVLGVHNQADLAEVDFAKRTQFEIGAAARAVGLDVELQPAGKIAHEPAAAQERTSAGAAQMGYERVEPG